MKIVKGEIILVLTKKEAHDIIKDIDNVDSVLMLVTLNQLQSRLLEELEKK